MPLSLSNAAIQQFKAQFELNYQAAEKLANTTTTYYNLRGDAFKIPYMGEGITTSRGAYQSLIAASDLTITQKSITFDNWTNNLPLDYFQEKEVQGNTLASLSQTHALAMGRRVDQVKIDALDADPGTSIGDGGTNMSVAKLRETKSAMDDANVQGMRYIVMTPNQIDALLADTSVTSILFNQQRTLVDGNIDTFLGFKFLSPIGTMAEGGLPKTGNIRSCFAWAEPAIATGFQIPPNVDVQWSASHQSWLTISRLRLGAVVTQNAGVIKIDCDETA